MVTVEEKQLFRMLHAVPTIGGMGHVTFAFTVCPGMSCQVEVSGDVGRTSSEEPWLVQWRVPDLR